MIGKSISHLKIGMESFQSEIFKVCDNIPTVKMVNPDQLFPLNDSKKNHMKLPCIHSF